ncbi:trypsin-like peptidase domain-containing protein [Gemmata sp. JC717]|uniref:Trypsin-like peptidase domain-containing protein n=1 Tax=Gemmata algarum TaxID=2975278 RepID=A0ABU5ETZ6_9BACT|nr:trypsin-like peptidase domain-containing protein [Gemmata algarum]MDY3554811.1 trypsin-like peptidase domain-containing protein [Gemmata algarum]MDY3558443.1 trypsin-like peptidase domain-containing protein [Gemmata algarum]
MGSVTVTSLLRFARRRLLAPAALSAAAVGLAALSPAFSEPPPTLTAGERVTTPLKRRDHVVDVYDRLKASVVNIHSERTVTAPGDDPFARQPVQPQRVNGMGTGIVVDPRGYILTNFHVVDDVNSLRVRLHDGAGYQARIISTDKEADLALIKIEPGKALPVIGLGTSSDLMVGESVIAIGNAFGYEHSVTEGRVSFKGRDVSLNKDMGYKGLIQTSAPINPGNSGGPLLNVLGEVVGVNVAIRAGAQNIGFALAVDAVIPRAADLIGVRRRLGVRHGLTLRDQVTREATESASRRIVTVEHVEANSPAAAAGFKQGDVLDQIDDISVATSIDFERGLIDRAVGAKIPVKVKRAGVPTDLEVSLQPAPKVALAAPDSVWRKLGLKVAPVGADAVAKANPQLRGGLLVTEIAAGSVAATAGVQKGDVLVGLHLWETLNIDNVTFVLNHKDLTTFLPLKYFVARDGKLKDGLITNVP